MFPHSPRDDSRDVERAARRMARRAARRAGRSAIHSVLIGGLIVTFGLSLLANNLGLADMSSILRRLWPFALVVVGVAKLFVDRPGSQFWGLVMIFGGLWIYADQRDWIHVPFWAVFGPTVLVLLGVMVVWRAFSTASARADSAETSAYISTSAIMSGSEHRPVTPFEGATLNAIMGGVKLDLSHAEMKGDTATIDVFAVMGGIEIYAPRDWEVTSNVVAFMGATVDERRPGQLSAGKTLIVRGFVMMGGVEIKD